MFRSRLGGSTVKGSFESPLAQISTTRQNLKTAASRSFLPGRTIVRHVAEIIVKTGLKSRSECSACRHPSGHALRMPGQKAWANQAIIYALETAVTKTWGFTGRGTTGFTRRNSLSIRAARKIDHSNGAGDDGKRVA